MQAKVMEGKTERSGGSFCFSRMAGSNSLFFFSFVAPTAVFPHASLLLGLLNQLIESN